MRVKPCNPPKNAVLVENVGKIEIPYSQQDRHWYLAHDHNKVFLSERESLTAFAVIHVPHHVNVILQRNIEIL